MEQLNLEGNFLTHPSKTIDDKNYNIEKKQILLDGRAATSSNDGTSPFPTPGSSNAQGQLLPNPNNNQNPSGTDIVKQGPWPPGSENPATSLAGASDYTNYWDGLSWFKFRFGGQIRTNVQNTSVINMSPLKNIISCELVAYDISSTRYSWFPQTSENFNTPQKQMPYLILDIEEFHGLNNFFGSNPACDGAFAYLPLFTNRANVKVGYKGSDHYRKIRYFNPPLASLESMTLKLKAPRQWNRRSTLFNGDFIPPYFGTTNSNGFMQIYGDDAILNQKNKFLNNIGNGPFYATVASRDMQFLFEFTVANPRLQII